MSDMSHNEDYYEDDDEYGYENNYKEHQERYESLHKEWVDRSNGWSDERKHGHLENMKIANDEYVSILIYLETPSHTPF